MRGEARGAALDLGDWLFPSVVGHLAGLVEAGGPGRGSHGTARGNQVRTQVAPMGSDDV